MEKRLHPLFQQSSDQPQSRIQAQFDPTPTNLTESMTAKNVGANSDTAEYIHESKLKMNRMSLRMTQMEDRFENFTAEVRAHFTKVAARLNERGLNETKIESMIERHNTAIHSFEKKLVQISRLLEDSQAQLMTTQGALEDARREIARLKKI